MPNNRLTKLMTSSAQNVWQWIWRKPIFQNIRRPWKKEKTKSQLFKTALLSKLSTHIVSNKAFKGNTLYYYENGYRKIHPYHSTRHTFCKQRWVGKTIRQIHKMENPHFPIENEMRIGNILLNLQAITSLDVKMQTNDFLTTKLHCHERPILDTDIGILYDDKDYLVVNKPSSVPVHPCGRYNHNSLIKMLRKEKSYKKLLPCNRIDRLTSGIVIFAKHSAAARKVKNQLLKRKIEKEYICKVVGEFPKVQNVTCSEPITVYKTALRCCVAWPVEGLITREALTVFQRISTDGSTSIVLCKPVTGRTHQIRVHLQYLGHPIVNDPIYNSPVWGPGRFKYGRYNVDIYEIGERMTSMYGYENTNTSSVSIHEAKREIEFGGNRNVRFKEAIEDQTNKNNQLTMKEVKDIIPRSVTRESRHSSKSPIITSSNSETQNDQGLHYCADCELCKNPPPEPNKQWMKMFLHALRYKSSDWEYVTPMPDWASQDIDNSKRTCHLK